MPSDMYGTLATLSVVRSIVVLCECFYSTIPLSQVSYKVGCNPQCQDQGTYRMHRKGETSGRCILEKLIQ
jgi:hypothetical protein